MSATAWLVCESGHTSLTVAVRHVAGKHRRRLEGRGTEWRLSMGGNSEPVISVAREGSTDRLSLRPSSHLAILGNQLFQRRSSEHGRRPQTTMHMQWFGLGRRLCTGRQTGPWPASLQASGDVNTNDDGRERPMANAIGPKCRRETAPRFGLIKTSQGKHPLLRPDTHGICKKHKPEGS
jgi:hypothetical protein